MTPLVDVVMVILIFLMLAGKFGGQEHYLSSNVPVSKSGATNNHDPLPDDTEIRIRVDTLPDRWVATAGEDPYGDAASLTAGLTAKHAAMEASGTKTEKMQVIIEPNRLVKFGDLMAVYEAALDAKFTKISFDPSHD